jgi:hypothetical protein
MKTDLEKELIAKRLTAPRITDKDVNDAIKSIQYHVFPDTTTTVCCITLTNGYTAIGHAACVSPENYDKDVGQKIAFTNAREVLWGLLGYGLAVDLHRGVLGAKHNVTIRG